MAGVTAINRAKEQGPKFSVQFGSMKLTLPELGISEQLGLN